MRIGIIGLSGSGKDTTAQILSDLMGYPVTAFAKPLHDAAVHIWGESYLERDQKETEQIFGENTFERFYSHHIKFESACHRKYNDIYTKENWAKICSFRNVFSNKNGIVQTISPRKFMQQYGTRYWREIKPDIFIRLVCDNYSDCIISDCRFTNEALVCDMLLNVVRNGVKPLSAHESEYMATDLLTLPENKLWQYEFAEDEIRHVYTVHNNGTKDDLRDNLYSFVNQHFKK